MNYNKKIKAIILKSITLEDYNQQSTIQNAYKIFQSEKTWEIEQNGELVACENWLRGLATACTIPYYNSDIMTQLGCSNDFASNRYWTVASELFIKMAEPRLPTIYEIEEATKEKSPYFFSRDTLRFFGQRMSSFQVYREEGKIFIFANSKHGTVTRREFINNDLELVR